MSVAENECGIFLDSQENKKMAFLKNRVIYTQNHIFQRNNGSFNHIFLTNNGLLNHIFLRNNATLAHIFRGNNGLLNHIFLRNNDPFAHISLRNNGFPEPPESLEPPESPELDILETAGKFNGMVFLKIF